MVHSKMITQQKHIKQDKKDIKQDKKEATQDNQRPKNYTAIVYGRLPPECRKQQAQQFNNFNLPYLVATNAIGMGLNF